MRVVGMMIGKVGDFFKQVTGSRGGDCPVIERPTWADDEVETNGSGGCKGGAYSKSEPLLGSVECRES